MKFDTAALALSICILFLVNASSANAQISPLMTVAAKPVLQDDFASAHKLAKETFATRQGTRWEIASGVLRGQQSSAEYQAARDHHRGYEPRISFPTTPAEFQISFRVKFSGGSENAIVPFVEFGHHVCRVKFSQTDGLSLLAKGETMKLAEATDFRWKPDQWYQVMAEMKAGHFVFQVADGPTLYARDDSFAKPPSSGGNGLGIAGPKKGFVEIDDLVIAEIRSRNVASWEATRAKFPEFTPVQVKEPKKKAPKKTSNTKKTKKAK